MNQIIVKMFLAIVVIVIDALYLFKLIYLFILLIEQILLRDIE